MFLGNVKSCKYHAKEEPLVEPQVADPCFKIYFVYTSNAFKCVAMITEHDFCFHVSSLSLWDPEVYALKTTEICMHLCAEISLKLV